MNNGFKIAILVFIMLTFTAPAWAKGNAENMQAAKILLTKSDRTMYLFNEDGDVIKRYNVSLGKDPVGHKVREGDGRTPEGRYIIDARNENSKYHLSLRISYPAKPDKARARRKGVNPGGDIFIHGLPNGKEWMTWKYNKKKDWTDGCIAVSNNEIKELWSIVPDGTPILILP
ncbi:MAG: L,D-transpeptidase family protein [Alphaproteobacteria bacterium]|nr:L,D-transpeptidase family protein [Alphaproteobacteria bacterium]